MGLKTHIIAAASRQVDDGMPAPALAVMPIHGVTVCPPARTVLVSTIPMLL